jgi:transposase
MRQTKLRTNILESNKNISFPIGTILAVQKYFKKLNLQRVFGKHKKKGRDINALIEAMISYKLTENLSMSKASSWINRDEVLQKFNLKKFDEQAIFRALKIVGKNREEIIAGIQDALFKTYSFEHTDVNLDWTSLVLYGNKAPLGKYGYSRDHRPDKKQITVGISELASPINVPIGLTVNAGNINDQKHFDATYSQVKRKLKPGSLVVFDKGADSKGNNETILNDKMKYLTSKKLNKSDDKRIGVFDKSKAELVDTERKVYGIKYAKPNSIDYFYFSEALEKEQMESKKRRAMRKYLEAKEIQESIDKNRKLPKKFRIDNELVDVTYTYQTKLKELSEEEAIKLVKSAEINGREGFFCIKSSENLTLEQALQTYRKKDSIEKIFNSLKNEIEIKPVRVWSDDSIYGVLIIGFIAQMFVSLMRYDHAQLKHISTKFIKNSLMNLTVTVNFENQLRKSYIYANFDPINEVILMKNEAIT